MDVDPLRLVRVLLCFPPRRVGGADERSRLITDRCFTVSTGSNPVLSSNESPTLAGVGLSHFKGCSFGCQGLMSPDRTDSCIDALRHYVVYTCVCGMQHMLCTTYLCGWFRCQICAANLGSQRVGLNIDVRFFIVVQPVTPIASRRHHCIPESITRMVVFFQRFVAVRFRVPHVPWDFVE